jgi:hypothetical protein
MLKRLIVLLALIAAAGCHVPKSADGMSGRAADEWTRTYTLAEGGEVSIVSPVGGVEIEAADGNTVEVRAERIARAMNDAAAAEILPRISIKEEIGPDRVSLRTESLGGIVIGVTIQVNYRVRAPRSATVRVRTSNNDLKATGFSGRVILNTVNAALTAEALSGSVEARATNGSAAITLTSFKADLIDVRVTNGNLQLTLPDSANANLNASATNGTVDVSTLVYERLGDQTGRRIRGRLNAGGAPVDLVTVNGNITVVTAGAGTAKAGDAAASSGGTPVSPSDKRR